jgi:arylsulfatase A-like enzyme
VVSWRDCAPRRERARLGISRTATGACSNWIDTTGLPEGFLTMRWTCSKAPARLPTTQVARLAFDEIAGRLRERARSRLGGRGWQIGAAALLLLGAALAAVEVRRAIFRVRQPDVVLVVIDTLRADALGAYGGPSGSSPRFDALAREGIVFERVIAPSSWTKTSMASILTGRDPARHDVRRAGDALPDELVTAAEVFSRGGYRTLGVNSNPWLTRPFRFDAGFSAYGSVVNASGERVTAAAVELLEAAGRDPVFLFVHYMDPHAPYAPSKQRFDALPVEVPGLGHLSDARLERLWREEQVGGEVVRRRVRDLYQAEVVEADAALGALVDALDARGRLRNAVVAVTSDHGEAFGEHGFVTHGQTLYPEVIRVPLVIVATGRLPAGMRVGAQVRSIDLVPTLFSLAGLDSPAGIEGVPLVPLEEIGGDRVARAAVGLNDQRPDRDFAAVVTRRFLYIHERRDGAVELYDLDGDPGAQRNLGAGHPEAGALAALEDHARAAPPPAIDLDRELVGKLRALGYAVE